MEHEMAFQLQLLDVHFIFHKQAKHGCCRNANFHSLLTLRCACLHLCLRSHLCLMRKVFGVLHPKLVFTDHFCGDKKSTDLAAFI